MNVKGELDDKRMLTTLQSMGNLGRKAARKGLRDGAKVEVGVMQDQSPDKSGTTASAIKPKAIKRSSLRIGMMAAVLKGKFPKAFYATFRELGSKHQPAKHTFKNAFLSGQSQAAGRIKQTIGGIIDSYKGEAVEDNDTE